MSESKNILITGARTFIALDLARKFHRSGHRVFVADTSRYHLTCYSNSVVNSYKVPTPKLFPKEYIDSLVEIVKKEKIDLLVPVYEEIFYISRALDAFSCEVFCSSFDVLNGLHNKWSFYLKQKSMGIAVPETILVSSQKDLEELKLEYPMALKASYSRASLQVKKATKEKRPKIEIETHNPWIAQKWLDGKKYCSFSLCIDGEIQAHTAYPVNYTIKSSCLMFEAVDHPGIYEWVENFVREEKFTGQIAFDFSVEEDGKIYAIECNPRGTSGIHLFDENEKILDVFFGKTCSLITPKEGACKQLFSGMLINGWKGCSSIFQFFSTIFGLSDVTFEKKDIKPFLMQPIIFIVHLCKSAKFRKNISSFYTYDMDWDGDIDE